MSGILSGTAPNFQNFRIGAELIEERIKMAMTILLHAG